MAGVVEVGTPRTLLEAVQNACSMGGVNEPATLVSPNRNTARAILAAKEALNRIWYATRWDWRWRWAVHNLVAGQMWYELPADYHAAGSTIGMHKAARGLTFKPYEWLLDTYPMIRALPPAFGDSQLVDEDIAADYSGNPMFWTNKGGYLGLWYPPSQDFIDATSSKIIAGYYANLIQPEGDGDELGIPVELYPAHENIMLGIFFHYREWPDWRITEDAGMAMLHKAVMAHRRVYWETSQLMPEDA